MHMMKKYLISLFFLAFSLSMPLTAICAPSFDISNTVSTMKDLLKKEDRNESLNAVKEFVKSTNNFIAATDGILKSISAISGKSFTPAEEWFPVVPKSVAPLLQEEKPDQDKVQAEVEKLLLIDRTDSETLKKTIEQQKVMLMKILTYSYAAAERSLDLSGDAYKETEELKKKIEEHEDIVTHVRQTVVLQMLSTRKMSEILHLQSRMLEIDSMMGLIKKERAAAEEQTDQSKTGTTPSTQTAQSEG